jgi:hypothetical protein
MANKVTRTRDGFTYKQIGNVRDYWVWDQDGVYVGVVGARSRGWIATPPDSKRLRDPATSATTFYPTRERASIRLALDEVKRQRQKREAQLNGPGSPDVAMMLNPNVGQ